MTEHIHTQRSSFGDPYCETCGADLELNTPSQQSPYTPTTEEIRDCYLNQLIPTGENTYEFIDEEQATEEFYRWLAERDRQVIKKAIKYLKTTPAVTLVGKGGAYELLEAYAQKIEDNAE